jgi:hypothetical protein
MSDSDPNAKPQDGTLNEPTVDYRTEAPEAMYPLQTPEDKGWEEFREQCRRQMKRPLVDRIKYGFVRRTGPSPGGNVSRAFDTMAEYREWCERHYPD